MLLPDAAADAMIHRKPYRMTVFRQPATSHLAALQAKCQRVLFTLRSDFNI